MRGTFSLIQLVLAGAVIILNLGCSSIRYKYNFPYQPPDTAYDERRDFHQVSIEWLYGE